MLIRINYYEILQFVSKKIGIDLSRVAIQTHSNDIVNVSYQFSKLLPAAVIGISIVSINNNIICFSYSCGPTLSLILAQFISYLQAKIPRGIKVDTDNCNVFINLSEINGMNQLLDDMLIDSLEFDGEAIMISTSLR